MENQKRIVRGQIFNAFENIRKETRRRVQVVGLKMGRELGNCGRGGWAGWSSLAIMACKA